MGENGVILGEKGMDAELLKIFSHKAVCPVLDKDDLRRPRYSIKIINNANTTSRTIEKEEG